VADANDICNIVATDPNYGFNHKTMNADKLYAFFCNYIFIMLPVKEKPEYFLKGELSERIMRTLDIINDFLIL